MGDFTGFTFEGVHSSDLGITRVSNGDRYDESLAPEVKDISTDIPGMDGEYYFGSTFGTKEFSIEIAYDSLTEQQIRRLRKVFHQKTVGELIFDERPYKKYLVKIESPIELSYVCFDEPQYTWEKIRIGDTEPPEYQKGVTGEDYEYKNYTGKMERIYKGEGSISFTGYYPFAKSVMKELTSAQEDSDWAISSGILSTNDKTTYHIDEVLTTGVPSTYTCAIPLYNGGDLSTGFVLYIPYATGEDTYMIDLVMSDGSGELHTDEIIVDTVTHSDEIGLIINSTNGMIEGVTSFENGQWTTSGQIYNKYIDLGTFFKIPPTVHPSEMIEPLELFIRLVGQAPSELEIIYDYLYL